MSLNKSEKTVMLLLLGAASTDYSQADRTAMRAQVLGQLGMTEQDAADHLAAAREQAEQDAADQPAEQAADDDAGDDPTTPA